MPQPGRPRTKPPEAPPTLAPEPAPEPAEEAPGIEDAEITDDFKPEPGDALNISQLEFQEEEAPVRKVVPNVAKMIIEVEQSGNQFILGVGNAKIARQMRELGWKPLTDASRGKLRKAGWREDTRRFMGETVNFIYDAKRPEGTKKR